MSPPTAPHEWLSIAARLRPYVARRVGAGPDVEDVLQEIMTRLHRGVAGLRDAERFSGWSFRIANHVIADAMRGRSRDPLTLVPTVLHSVDEAELRLSVDEAAQLEADLGQCVAQFVARLPSPYREAITLTELEGLTQKNASEMLGVSLSAMKSRVQRGREKIRDMFDECCRITLDCKGRVLECESRPVEEVPEDCRAAAVAWIARRGR